MCKELDPENVGVILFNKFLDSFYSVEQSFMPPDTFDIFHYNGMESSCPDNKVKSLSYCTYLYNSCFFQ